MISISGAMEVSFTPDTAAYVDGDVVGGLLTFSSIPATADGGILSSIVLTEDDNEGADLDLFLFDSAPSTIADNAAFAPTIADLQKLVTKVAIAAADYGTENSLKYVVKEDINVPFPSRQMFGYLVLNGVGATFAASKTIKIRAFFTT